MQTIARFFCDAELSMGAGNSAAGKSAFPALRLVRRALQALRLHPRRLTRFAGHDADRRPDLAARKAFLGGEAPQ
jgi:hypothetical protein